MPSHWKGKGPTRSLIRLVYRSLPEGETASLRTGRSTLRSCLRASVLVIVVTIALLVMVVFFSEDATITVDKFTGNILNWTEKDGICLDKEGSRRSLSTAPLIDYSRCPADAPLRVFVYDSANPLATALATSAYSTKNASDACFFIAVVNASTSRARLEHWSAGTNHIIVNVDRTRELEPIAGELLLQENFLENGFRGDVDFIGSVALLEKRNDHTWQNRTSLLPLHREHKLVVVLDGETKWPEAEMAKLARAEGVLRLECQASKDHKQCVRAFSSSLFVVLRPSLTFQLHLLASLRAGAIPVILSDRKPNLPFHDFLDWRLASVHFPLERLASLASLLAGLPVPTLLEFRRRGRIFLDAYLNDADGFSHALLASLSSRLALSPRAASPTPSKSPFNGSFSPPLLHTIKGTLSNLTHQRISSPATQHPFLDYSTHSYSLWNNGRDVAFLPPSLFDERSLPAEVEHYEDTQQGVSSLYGIHSIAKYGSSLGGQRREEQFTAVILTYDRDVGLINVLENLNGCPHLNKFDFRVLVVWNNLARSPSNISWPSLHVPVEFILPEANSLNNRFLPFDRLETDAVVSLDDDIDVTHDELEFAFRVWRGSPDRLVGFPSRYHKWQGGKSAYGTGASCEFSLILTGYAFIHRNFLYEYFRQPRAILSHIDSIMNCEDIAMNFLVAHLTRKAPVKIADKSIFQCKKCQVGLSSTGKHYEKRDDCIALFTRIYGYNPLIGSQERSQAAHPGKCMKTL